MDTLNRPVKNDGVSTPDLLTTTRMYHLHHPQLELLLSRSVVCVIRTLKLVLSLTHHPLRTVLAQDREYFSRFLRAMGPSLRLGRSACLVYTKICRYTLMIVNIFLYIYIIAQSVHMIHLGQHTEHTKPPTTRSPVVPEFENRSSPEVYHGSIRLIVQHAENSNRSLRVRLKVVTKMTSLLNSRTTLSFARIITTCFLHRTAMATMTENRLLAVTLMIVSVRILGASCDSQRIHQCLLINFVRWCDSLSDEQHAGLSP